FFYSFLFFFFSSRRRHTRSLRDWSSDVCSSDLRGFGSQGEQRLTVLSLLLAEAQIVAEERGVAPLLLLDDVLSELDSNRRHVLRSEERRVGKECRSRWSPDY